MAKRLITRSPICFAALLASSVLAQTPESLLETPTALAFGAPPTIDDPSLSPDGTKLMFLQQDPQGVTLLRMLDLSNGQVAGLLAGAPNGLIQWCEWVKEDRVLCDLRQGLMTGRDYQLYYALNADGSGLKEMRRNVPCRGHRSLRDDPPIDVLPDEAAQIMIVCGGSAHRLDVDSGRLTDVSGAGQAGTAPYLFSDGHGLGSMYRAQEDDLVRWYERDDVSSSWERFHESNPLRFEDPFRPVGLGRDLNEVFHIGSESGRWALYVKDLENGYEDRLVFSHPIQDLELVDTLGPYNRVVAVAYLDGRPQRHFVDERVAAVHAAVTEQLKTQLTGEQNVEVVDESWDERKYLIRVRSPRRAGYFMLFDMESGTAQGIAPEYAHLASYDLAETLSVQFQGPDGDPVSAHLTIPRGYEWPLPTVIIPRGAPSHRDLEDPHYLVQFLAANGYAVLRVDTRSFEGYGGGWLPVRAVAGWQQTADDLNWAVRYLVSEGVTDADRVCAAGRDYGAYSAFMAAIRHSDLFQCIVSIAGISNPRDTPGATVISNTLSGLAANVLEESSPFSRAGEIDPPILLFHGQADAEISYSTHAVDFVNALNRAGKDVTFIDYEFGDNEIKRGPYRVDMLARIGQFLAEHLSDGT